MKYRCSKKSCPEYKHYGGRGITFCKAWLSFENFYKDMGDCPPKLSLDRIDNNGNYEPENCRWATRSQQLRNTRANRLITYNGKTKCMTEWAIDLGIDVRVLHHRICRGYPIEKVMSAAGSIRQKKWIVAFGKTQSLTAWAKEVGIARLTIHRRIKLGWSIESALTSAVL